MLKFYFNGSPNPTKVALYLEEAGLPFEPVKIDTRTGEQFTPDYLKINPNGKVPAIDDNGTIVFDSNAILLYLAEKTGKFLPAANVRGEMLSWLMFVATGVGPYSGQAVHFKHFAPKDQNHDYAHTAISSRPIAITRFSTATSKAAAIWSATAIRSSTWRCGGGRGWCRSSSATMPSRDTRT